MIQDELLEKIRSRGHWRVNFRPVTSPLKDLSLLECRDAVDKCSVGLRGWNYPYVSNKADSHRARKNSYEGTVSWHQHIEFWRMYQSSQFVHYFTMEDDWTEIASWAAPPLTPGKFLEAVGHLFYQVGEVFEFLARLARHGLYQSGAAVSVELIGTKGRRLYLTPGSLRGRLRSDYECADDQVKVAVNLSPSELANTTDAAVSAAIHVAQRFQWLDPSPAVLKECVADYMLGRRR